MSLMRPLSSLREDLNRVFSDLEQEFLSPWSPGRRRLGEPEAFLAVWTPPVDVVEDEKEIRVKALVPGIKPEDLSIEVEDHTLCLSGESFKKEEEEKGNFYRKEITHAKVFRRIQLPTDVQGEKAKADFENGMLTVTIPKSEETRRHKIKVSRK